MRAFTFRVNFALLPLALMADEVTQPSMPSRREPAIAHGLVLDSAGHVASWVSPGGLTLTQTNPESRPTHTRSGPSTIGPVV